MKRLNTSFCLLAFLFSFSSCLVQEQARPDTEIVVIGNGAEGGVDWNRTLVVDVKTNLGLIESQIAEKKALVPVLKKLADLGDAEAKDLLDETSREYPRVGWISPSETSDATLIRLSPGSRSKIQASRQEVSTVKACSVLEVGQKSVNCRGDLQTYDISISKSPISSTEGLAFVNFKNDLYLRQTKAAPILIAEKVRHYFVSAQGFLFFENEDHTWLYKSLQSLQKPMVLTQNDLVYRGASGRVFIFPFLEGPRLQQNLKAHHLYEFFPESMTFALLWENPEPLSFHIDLLNQKKNVLGDRIILNVEKQDPSIKKSAILVMGPESLQSVNVYSGLFGSRFDILTGEKIFFLRPDYSEKSKNLVGQVCGLVEENNRNEFLCRVLVLPENQFVRASTLGEERVVLAASLNEAEGSSFKIAVIESDLLSSNFGMTKKTWRTETEVQALRFFDLQRPSFEEDEIAD